MPAVDEGAPAGRPLLEEDTVMRKGMAGLLSLVATAALNPSLAAAADPGGTTALRDDWTLQTSVKAKDGAAISQPGFATAGWYKAKVPSTVLGSLVDAGVYKDPFFAKNMSKISQDPFKTSWWYRKEFAAGGAPRRAHPAGIRGPQLQGGAWLNGKETQTKANLLGVWHHLVELDVDATLRDGANALAVEVFPPVAGDYTLGFVDWNPVPADKNMGLYRDVQLRRTGTVSAEDVFVQTKVDTKTLKEASLTVSTALVNHGDKPVTGTVTGEIGKIRFQVPYTLAASEKKALSVSPAEAAALKVRNPKLWWPNNLGEPDLYRLELEADVEGPSDRREVDFGIRQFGDYLDAEGHRAYTVNGKPILVRGGGWVDDLLLADSDRRLEDQMRTCATSTSTPSAWRGSGAQPHELYELADRHGILVWVGWSCQWEWENYLGQPVDETFGAVDTEAEMDLVTRSLRDQVIRLRNHPSVMVWNLGSDMLPRPALERRYRELLAEIDPTRPPLAACSVRTSEVSGPTGVKMNGPLRVGPPRLLVSRLGARRRLRLQHRDRPGARSRRPLRACGACCPPRTGGRSTRCGTTTRAATSSRPRAATSRRSTPATAGRGGLEEFAASRRRQAYEAMRPMFEAYSRSKYISTGVIQWMLNNAWPT